MTPFKKKSSPLPNRRIHIVLIPGFGGFDALGQLEYYARVTPHFGEWKKAGGSERQAAVLHYFDNFPTAAVVTRSKRLRNYLAKRIARGEFLPDDRIALVGHSTGGLDIRRLLWDLVADYKTDAKTRYAVDGTRGSDFAVAPAEILDRIARVVFLSVPQFGTNIADWVRAHDLARHAVVADLRASVATSQVPVLDRLQELLTGYITGTAKLNLFDAVQDALCEAEPPLAPTPMRTLLAQEAAAELALWVRHMCSDFSAIEDLSAEPDGDEQSPAHFSDEIRKREMTNWDDHDIATQSYASIGARPFEFDPQHAAPRWELLHPWSWPEITPATSARTGTDIVYRTCYRACAGGPFEYPDIKMAKPPVLADENGAKHAIAIWDNDGVVNTASMLWPNCEDTVLINADHMDIVGHYKRVHSTDANSDREYDAYDLLKSGSGFDSETFAKVWDGAFEFCVA
ncbi:MAG TPA: hypothetical protein VMU45_01760 [Candidatus Eisenbacteria bacterium]|nr:hypothetical protein [Candidatus Eisenbacteria bacterium]